MQVSYFILTIAPGFIGMALSYGLSINSALVYSIQYQCNLENYIVSVERINQYSHIPSEAQDVSKANHPPIKWPDVGKVEIKDLKVIRNYFYNVNHIVQKKCEMNLMNLISLFI
jgi:methyl coenzyme M reductase subunit C